MSAFSKKDANTIPPAAYSSPVKKGRNRCGRYMPTISATYRDMVVAMAIFPPQVDFVSTGRFKIRKTSIPKACRKSLRKMSAKNHKGIV